MLFRLIFILVLSFSLHPIFPLQLSASDTHLDHLTINLPDKLIIKELKNALPIDITPESSHLKGSLVITDIGSLKIKKTHIYTDLSVTGKNLDVTTKIGSRSVRLDLGSMDFHLQGKAALHFDSKEKILFIRPFINDVQSNNKGQQETVKLLLPLINDIQFPVSMGDLRPVTAKIRKKPFYIFMDIVDIQLTQGGIKIYIVPHIKSVNSN